MRTQRFCSKKCSKENHRICEFNKRGDKSWRKEISCKICKTQFMPKCHNGTTCSKKCKTEYSRIAMNKKAKYTPIAEKYCVICKSKFSTGRSQKITCSEFCSHKNKIAGASNRPYRKQAKFKMYHSMRVAINTRIRAKNVKTSDMCNYTPEQLKIHIESLFRPGMTWDNYGIKGWHIDHKKPLSLFNFFDIDGNINLDEIRACMSLDNLQPLWAKENLIKSNKYNLGA